MIKRIELLGSRAAALQQLFQRCSDQKLDQSYEVTPASCTGVIFGAESTVHAGTGLVALFRG
jgi:hypothetical protein